MRARARTGALVASLAVVLAACGAAAEDPDTAEPADTEEAGPEDAPDGEPAPDVEFETFDGEQLALSDLRGQPLVVNFWASWCPPCIAEMPYIESVHQDLGDEVQFLGINTQDSLEPALDLVDETGVTYQLALDPQGEIFQAFGVFTMPSTFFINEEGEIVGTHGGILTEQQLRDQIQEDLAVS